MRRAIFGVALAFSLASVAHASDFIVVNSTDPAIARGAALDAGIRLPLAVGKTVTLMRPSGEITVLKGSPSGVTTPQTRLAQADTARLDALRALVQPPPQGRTFGARRSGICTPAAALTTMDDILRAADGGCKSQARAALDAYVARSADTAATTSDN